MGRSSTLLKCHGLTAVVGSNPAHSAKAKAASSTVRTWL